jgi:hypothetical protein
MANNQNILKELINTTCIFLPLLSLQFWMLHKCQGLTLLPQRKFYKMQWITINQKCSCKQKQV